MIKSERDRMNKSAFHFSSQASVRVRELCEPLCNIGITFFRYLKVFEDCSYITLMNGYNDVLSSYYEVILDLGHIWGAGVKNAADSDTPFYMVWPQDGHHKDINMGLFYNYNIWNGISLIYRSNRYVEIVSFAFDRQMDQGGNILLNSINFIEDFAEYFRQQVCSIVGEEDISKRAIFPRSFDLSKQSNSLMKKQKILRDSMLIGANILNTAHGVVRLTDKEMGCLKLFAEGGTAKSIARKANISHRTVEYHLSKMKCKTNSSSKSDLLDLFFRNLDSK